MRQENFLGIPVTVVNDDEVAEEAARDSETIRSYIVPRVKDIIVDVMPPALKARRLRTLCEKCGELCYIDPKCLETFRAMPLEIICGRCFVATAGHDRIEASSAASTWKDTPRTPDQDET